MTKMSNQGKGHDIPPLYKAHMFEHICTVTDKHTDNYTKLLSHLRLIYHLATRPGIAQVYNIVAKSSVCIKSKLILY